MNELLAEVNKSLVLIGFLSTLVTIVVLIKRSWAGIKESWAARSLLAVEIAIGALLLVNTLTLYLGSDYPAREFVRVLVYSGIPLTQVVLTIVIATFTAAPSLVRQYDSERRLSSKGPRHEEQADSSTS